ncbi:MAG TPA: glycosyltransferase, partial [Actinomycetota bacterium]|nr:glycosyltransferase [Actinomycetota bacterium]
MTARPEARSSLSIVLPCFDEAGRLPGTLAAYLAHFPPTRAEVELIVVDDGSTDGTSAIADQLASA